MESTESRFLRYVQVDTPSDENNPSVTPSTPCQHALARMLCEELRALGLNAEVTENAYVYSAIEANCEGATAIGFIAHIDVVGEPKGYGVKPQVIRNYGGGDIVLPCGRIKASDFPELSDYVGKDIVTSDGSTILGADDKAGVAEIMSLVQYLVNHPEIRHGRVGIAFTPDEEIGHGAALFDLNKFGCKYAYTVDGEEMGEISYETFNGASFKITVNGVNIHPGQAKGRMINAVTVANEIISAFPADERPETTEGREGYYFIMSVEGGVEKCMLHGIIRDHDSDKFDRRKQYVRRVVEDMRAKYGDRISVEIADQYRNCAEVIAPHIHLVENVRTAMRELGIQPITQPVRGGTDGSQLSYMGLPCPNICTGGRNAHGLNEFIAIQDMEKVVQILLKVVCAYAK